MGPAHPGQLTLQLGDAAWYFSVFQLSFLEPSNTDCILTELLPGLAGDGWGRKMLLIAGTVQCGESYPLESAVAS